MNEVAKIEATTVAETKAAQTPLAMIQHAIDGGASPDTLEKLMALAERHEANNARRAFDFAMSQAKAKIGPIVKRSEVDFETNKGRTHYRYETLADIDAQVDPILSEFGLSCRFRSKDDGNTVTIICAITHKDGHREETSLSGPADTSGNKNPYQAKGSAVTYLQRYTKKIALGLSATVDDDATSATPEPAPMVSAEQYIRIRDLAAEVRVSESQICKAYDVPSLQQIPAAAFDACISKLEASRPAQKPAPIDLDEDEIPY